MGITKQYEAVKKIVNLSRNANGWQSKVSRELDEIVEAWMQIINHYKIPYQYLDNLYFRAFEARQRTTWLFEELNSMSTT
jgi:hypothetical protein